MRHNLSVEATTKKCEVCGREFTCQDEANDDYSGYCSTCYKAMIQRRYADSEYDGYEGD